MGRYGRHSLHPFLCLFHLVVGCCRGHLPSSALRLHSFMNPRGPASPREIFLMFGLFNYQRMDSNCLAPLVRPLGSGCSNACASSPRAWKSAAAISSVRKTGPHVGYLLQRMCAGFAASVRLARSRGSSGRSNTLTRLPSALYARGPTRRCRLSPSTRGKPLFLTQALVAPSCSESSPA